MNFSNRHIGIDSKAEKIMLEYLGLKNIESLIEETIPDEIRLKQNISLEAEMSEAQFLDHIYKLSQENRYLHFSKISKSPLSPEMKRVYIFNRL